MSFDSTSAALATFALAFVSSPLVGTTFASPGDFTLEPMGGANVRALGDDRFEVSSDGGEPMAAIAGEAARIRFDSADVAPAEVELGVAVQVGGVPSGTFTLTFNGETTSPFSGRLLTAKDLTSEQDGVFYRPAADWYAAEGYTFVLERGGVSVAVVDVDDGVAPFVLDRVPDAFAASARAAAGGGHAQQIELHSYSFGQSAVTMDDGRAFIIDTIEVHAHEVGHLVGLAHTVGTKTVAMGGVDAMTVAVLGPEVELVNVAALEVQAAPNSSGGIDLWSTGLGNVDVHCVSNHVGALARDVRVRVSVPAGYELRMRSRTASDGAWTAWTAGRVERRVVAPAAGGETFDDYVVEVRASNTSHTIATHGYIRIKKLNSGG